MDFNPGDRVRVSKEDEEYAGKEGEYIGIIPIEGMGTMANVRLDRVLIELNNGEQILVVKDHLEKAI